MHLFARFVTAEQGEPGVSVEGGFAGGGHCRAERVGAERDEGGGRAEPAAALDSDALATRVGGSFKVRAAREASREASEASTRAI